MDALTGFTVSDKYNEILRVSGGLSLTWKTVKDGLGNEMAGVEASVSGLRGMTFDGYATARLATTANVTLSGLQTIDGVLMADGETVLLAGQTTPSENGLWNVSSGAWQRAPVNLIAGGIIGVSEGDINFDSLWMLTTNDPFIIGTSALNFSRVFASVITTTDSYETSVVGDGINSDFAVTHNLSTDVISVVAFEDTSGNEVVVGVQSLSINDVQLTILPIPSIGETFNVKVIG